MIEVSLTQGKTALIDDDMAHLLKWVWCLHRTKSSVLYAKRGDKYGAIFLHHLVVGRPFKGYEVDHIDGNGLNNCKSNLRIVSHRQNLQNQNVRINGKTSSKFPGVCWDRGKWKAHIRIEGKLKHLGRFVDEKEAGISYVNALRSISSND